MLYNQKQKKSTYSRKLIYIYCSARNHAMHIATAQWRAEGPGVCLARGNTPGCWKVARSL